MRWSNVVPQTETRRFIRASLVTVGSCPVCHLAGSVKKLNLVNASDLNNTRPKPTDCIPYSTSYRDMIG